MIDQGTLGTPPQFEPKINLSVIYLDKNLMIVDMERIIERKYHHSVQTIRSS